jgi:hypothetical protein
LFSLVTGLIGVSGLAHQFVHLGRDRDDLRSPFLDQLEIGDLEIWRVPRQPCRTRYASERLASSTALNVDARNPPVV